MQFTQKCIAKDNTIPIHDPQKACIVLWTPFRHNKKSMKGLNNKKTIPVWVVLFRGGALVHNSCLTLAIKPQGQNHENKNKTHSP